MMLREHRILQQLCDTFMMCFETEDSSRQPSKADAMFQCGCYTVCHLIPHRPLSGPSKLF